MLGDLKIAKGKGLQISDWANNDAFSSFDRQDNKSSNVFGFHGKNLGRKTGKVHTHPGAKGYPDSGFSNPSRQDEKNRIKNKNINYPHFINSRYGDWQEY